MVLFGTVSYEPYVEFNENCPSDCATECLPKDFSFPLFEHGVAKYFNEPVHLIRCETHDDLFNAVAQGVIDYGFPINSASLPPTAAFNLTNGELPPLRWIELFSTPIIIMFDPSRTLMSPWFISVKQIFMLSPFFALILTGCFISGVCMWLLERKENQRDFGDPKPFRGILSATWFIAVTVTTVGYGEQAPRTWTGRIVALIWMCGYYVMFTTIAMTATNLLSNWREFGSREVFNAALSQNQAVGTLKNSFAHAYTHRISSQISPTTKTEESVLAFDTVQDLCQAMVDKTIFAAYGSAPVLRTCDLRYLKDTWQLLQGDLLDEQETYELIFRHGNDDFVHQVLAPLLQKTSRSALYFDLSMNQVLHSVAWQQYLDNLQSFGIAVCYITGLVVITATIKLVWYSCYFSPKRRKRTLTSAHERIWDNIDSGEIEMNGKDSSEPPPPSPKGFDRKRTHSRLLSEQYSALAKAHSTEMQKLEQAFASKKEALKRKHYATLQDNVPYLSM